MVKRTDASQFERTTTTPRRSWRLFMLILWTCVCLSAAYAVSSGYHPFRSPSSELLHLPLFRVVDLPGKGKGVIATRNIEVSQNKPCKTSIEKVRPTLARVTHTSREAALTHPLLECVFTETMSPRWTVECSSRSHYISWLVSSRLPREPGAF